MASRNPWFRFHQKDYLSHLGVRSVTLEARGLWVELICHMRERETGTLAATVAGIARGAGIETARCKELLVELRDANVAEVDFDEAGAVTVTSRRVTRDLVEEAEEREDNAERNREYRARLRDARVTQTSGVTAPSRDARVTPRAEQSRAEVEQSSSPATPTTQTSDGIRAGARAGNAEASGGGGGRPKTGEPPDTPGTPARASAAAAAPYVSPWVSGGGDSPSRCSCVEGFDAAAGRCCRRCERGRERARRVTTAARHDDAQAARASRDPKAPQPAVPYSQLAARIGTKASVAHAAAARAPPTVQVAP